MDSGSKKYDFNFLCVVTLLMFLMGCTHSPKAANTAVGVTDQNKNTEDLSQYPNHRSPTNADNFELTQFKKRVFILLQPIKEICSTKADFANKYDCDKGFMLFQRDVFSDKPVEQVVSDMCYKLYQRAPSIRKCMQRVVSGVEEGNFLNGGKTDLAVLCGVNTDMFLKDGKGGDPVERFHQCIGQHLKTAIDKFLR